MNVKFEYFSEYFEATNLSVVTKNLSNFMSYFETQVCIMCGNISSLCTQQTRSLSLLSPSSVIVYFRRQLSNWRKWASNFKNSLIQLFRPFINSCEINIWAIKIIIRKHSYLHLERLVFGLITDDWVPTLLEETRDRLIML